MGGINFIDIAKLRASNIVGERLLYKREKTKKIIIIPHQLPALQIIKRYMTEPGTFIFPILTSFHQTEVQIANRLHKVLAKVNRDLKEIGKRLKLSIPLTTYVARHSFATVLKKSEVSTSIISETLGHPSEKVTQIYLDSFDNEKINIAMKNLL